MDTKNLCLVIFLFSSTLLISQHSISYSIAESNDFLNKENNHKNRNSTKGVIFSEDFEDGVMPSGWTTIAGDCDWEVSNDGSSESFEIPPTSFYAYVNDDWCDGDMSDVWLISPLIDFSGFSSVSFSFWSVNEYDDCKVMISTDGGSTWEEINYLDDNATWTEIEISLDDYVGNQVKIAFQYCDLWAWGYGWAIDDIIIQSIENNDIGIEYVKPSGYFQAGMSFYPYIQVTNFGTLSQDDFIISLTINDGISDIYTSEKNIISANLSYGQSQIFYFDDIWMGELNEEYFVHAEIILTGDEFTTNNLLDTSATAIEIHPAYVINQTHSSFSTLLLNDSQESFIEDINTFNFPMALEFSSNGNLFLIRYSPAQLSMLDYSTGIESIIGEIIGATGSPTSLSYNWLTETMYMICLDSDFQPHLGTIDLETAIYTEIGTGEGAIIAAEFDILGNLYGIAIDSDKLYQINTSTGLTTEVGSLGIDINYGQDISFDRLNEKMFGLLNTNFSGLYEINLSTGNCLIIDTLENQYSCFEIADWQYCSSPAYLYADNISLNSADFHWAELGSANLWNLKWGPMGFDISEGTIIDSLIASDYSISGLLEGEYYSFYIQSVCDESNSSWVGPYTFNTLPDCTNLTNIEEGFENSVPPFCWNTFQNGFGTNTWEQTNELINTGSFSAIANWENSGGVNQQWLVSPNIQLFDNPSLSFYISNAFEEEYFSNFIVKVSTDDDYLNTSEYSDILTLSESDISYNCFNLIEVDLSSFSGQNVFIAFVMVDDNGDSWYLDDIQLENTVTINLEPQLTNNISIFPNPNNGYYNILNANGYNVEIYDLTGKKVHAFFIDNQMFTPSLDMLSDGTYLMKFEKDGKFVKKVLQIIK
ncbi:MAG: choice-of-anchor J domain-containing protein [Bacteroidales bacterium]|nr:choice-of-anchor J domain-containing protein [Bacteroidales bacterium]